MKNNSLIKRNKGITLIALVITIIVLLILAGVSIAALSGQNGILTKAQNAASQTKAADAKEQVQLAVTGSLDNSGNIVKSELHDKLVKNLKASVDKAATEDFPWEVTLNEQTVIIKADGTIENKGQSAGGGEGTTQEGVIIPAGFYYVGGTKDTGLVISDEVGDDLNNTKRGNQFVWVPVEGTYERNKTYADTNVSSNACDDIDITTSTVDDNDTESYLPTGITNEKTAVENAGGFYISRYEAGKPEGAINGKTAPISQKGAAVWTDISYNNGDIKKSAKAMYNNANVKSSVLTGIQWDMTMKFVNGKKDGNGKIYNVTAYDSTRHISGGVTIAGNNIADKVANIYDLEGNAWEYVAEKNTYYSSYPYVSRGGYYNYDYSASFRNFLYGSAYSTLSFRLALYVAL